MKKRTKYFLIAAVVIVVAFVAYAVVGPLMSRVEEAKYTVLADHGDIQIRRYAPLIVAEVTFAGERKEALTEGFRALADYIFGNNTAAGPIAMTAPVRQGKSEKIAMTTPVRQQQGGQRWVTQFVMPAKYTMQSIPKPNNPLVQLIEQQAERFLVIRFSGRNSDENIQANLTRIEQFAADKAIVVAGKPIFAFYNPPWTLPFMRRNEILLPLPNENR